jgi:hypothetical protein
LQFEQAVKNAHKYQNIKLIKDENLDNINNVRVFIINYNKYYYFFSVVNIHTNAEDEKNPKDRHIIFKKLTKQELKEYDNGSYWKLIQDYNIQID